MTQKTDLETRLVYDTLHGIKTGKLENPDSEVLNYMENRGLIESRCVERYQQEYSEVAKLPEAISQRNKLIQQHEIKTQELSYEEDKAHSLLHIMWSTIKNFGSFELQKEKEDLVKIEEEKEELYWQISDIVKKVDSLKSMRKNLEGFIDAKDRYIRHTQKGNLILKTIEKSKKEILDESYSKFEESIEKMQKLISENKRRKGRKNYTVLPKEIIERSDNSLDEMDYIILYSILSNNDSGQIVSQETFETGGLSGGGGAERDYEVGESHYESHDSGSDWGDSGGDSGGDCGGCGGGD